MAEPKNMNRLRRATEAEEPTTDFISVVSAVRRDRTSPVRVTSKKHWAEPRYMRIDRLAQVGCHALADPGYKKEAGGAGRAQNNSNNQQGQKIAVY